MLTGLIGKDSSPPFSVPDPPSSPVSGDVRGRVVVTEQNTKLPADVGQLRRPYSRGDEPTFEFRPTTICVFSQHARGWTRQAFAGKHNMRNSGTLT